MYGIYMSFSQNNFKFVISLCYLESVVKQEWSGVSKLSPNRELHKVVMHAANEYLYFRLCWQGQKEKAAEGDKGNIGWFKQNTDRSSLTNPSLAKGDCD